MERCKECHKEFPTIEQVFSHRCKGTVIREINGRVAVKLACRRQLKWWQLTEPEDRGELFRRGQEFLRKVFKLTKD